MVTRERIRAQLSDMNPQHRYYLAGEDMFDADGQGNTYGMGKSVLIISQYDLYRHANGGG